MQEKKLKSFERQQYNQRKCFQKSVRHVIAQNPNLVEVLPLFKYRITYTQTDYSRFLLSN